MTLGDKIDHDLPNKLTSYIIPHFHLVTKQATSKTPEDSVLFIISQKIWIPDPVDIIHP